MSVSKTYSPDETRAAGRAFAKTLKLGDVVLLEGPLGSGKTTFVQGVAEGLGAREAATSPSFVIVNEYTFGSGQQAVGSRDTELTTAYGPLPTTLVLRHIDLYRLPLPRAASRGLPRAVSRGDPVIDLDRIGLPELLNDPQAITVIEWADRLPAGLVGSGARVFRVRLHHGQRENERKLDIEGYR